MKTLLMVVLFASLNSYAGELKTNCEKEFDKLSKVINSNNDFIAEKAVDKASELKVKADLVLRTGYWFEGVTSTEAQQLKDMKASYCTWFENTANKIEKTSD